jgi:hypothetical protein
MIYEQLANEMLAEYRQRSERAGDLRRQLGEVSVSAMAPREVVRVTVDARGAVSAVDFPVSMYKRMAPAELSEVIMTTIRQAREKALAAVRDLMAAELPEGPGLLSLIDDTADFGTLSAGVAPIPDAVREYLAQGADPQAGTLDG